jgi:hypothetical protein
MQFSSLRWNVPSQSIGLGSNRTEAPEARIQTYLRSDAVSLRAVGDTETCTVQPIGNSNVCGEIYRSIRHVKEPRKSALSQVANTLQIGDVDEAVRACGEGVWR